MRALGARRQLDRFAARIAGRRRRQRLRPSAPHRVEHYSIRVREPQVSWSCWRAAATKSPRLGAFVSEARIVVGVNDDGCSTVGVMRDERLDANKESANVADEVDVVGSAA